jgi:hypothetical protein
MIGRACSSASFLSVPYQMLALFPVGLGRLPVDQGVDFPIAVAGVIPHGTADEILVELLVGVVYTALGAGAPANGG